MSAHAAYTHAAIIRAILIGHSIDVHDGVLAWLHACEVAIEFLRNGVAIDH